MKTPNTFQGIFQDSNFRKSIDQIDRAKGSDDESLSHLLTPLFFDKIGALCEPF